MTATSRRQEGAVARCGSTVLTTTQRMTQSLQAADVPDWGKAGGGAGTGEERREGIERGAREG